MNKFNNISEIPDTLLNDLITSIGIITENADKSVVEENPELAKDLTILKTAVNQKNVSDELHKSSSRLSKLTKKDVIKNNTTSVSNENNNQIANDGIIGLSKSVTRSEIDKIIDECIPCLDRPEIAGAFKSAVSELFKMFYQLVGMFDVFANMITFLIPPKNAYSLVCDLLNAFRATCIPDLMRIILLIKWYISDLFIEQMKKFSLVIDINLDIIFIPFYAGLQVLISGIIDMLLTPIQCIITSFKTQAAKIVGNNNNKEYKVTAPLVLIADKLQEAMDAALNKLTMVRHDWNSYMCQLNLQIKQALVLLENINNFLSILAVIKSIINIKQATRNCDVRDETVQSVLKDVYDIEIIDNNIVTKPPITIDEKEESIINDIIDTFNEIHDGTKITDNNGQVVTYNDIHEYVNSLYNNDGDIRDANSSYASETTYSYRTSNMDNLKDIIDLFSYKNVIKIENTDNITNDDNKYIKIDEVKSCYGDNS